VAFDTAALAAASSAALVLDRASAAEGQASVAAASIAAANAHTAEVGLADLAVAPADMALEAVAVVHS